MNAAVRPLLCILGAMLAGCYSIDVAHLPADGSFKLAESDSTPFEHVVISNSGWYLFNRLPLVCGNTSPDAWFPFKFFSDEVHDDLLHDIFMHHAAERDASVRNLAFIYDDKVMFDVPVTTVTVPIPYILSYREIQFSGVLTRRPDGQEAP